jgi:hypothetical protein
MTPSNQQQCVSSIFSLPREETNTKQAFLLGSIFNLEDGGEIFLQIVG